MGAGPHTLLPSHLGTHFFRLISLFLATIGAGGALVALWVGALTPSFFPVTVWFL